MFCSRTNYFMYYKIISKLFFIDFQTAEIFSKEIIDFEADNIIFT